ncbi:MAG: hypothetical protein ACM3ZA_06920 [Bacillota bacterium]
MRPGLHPTPGGEAMPMLPGCRGLDWDDWPALAHPKQQGSEASGGVVKAFAPSQSPEPADKRRAEAV